ncbi:MAG: hypothetical protein ACT4PI_08075 [Actinomycetota bacterium]
MTGKPDDSAPGNADAEEREEARRWRGFVDAFFAHVPEVRASLEETRDPESTIPFRPADISIQVTCDLLDDADYPRGLDPDVWPRILAFLEVAQELVALLEAELAPDHEDVMTVAVFGECGIVCDVTGSVVGLRELLPWMGPRTVAAARREVEYHKNSRGWATEEVDWSGASSRFVPLITLRLEQLRPID